MLAGHIPICLWLLVYCVYLFQIVHEFTSVAPFTHELFSPCVGRCKLSPWRQKWPGCIWDDSEFDRIFLFSLSFCHTSTWIGNSSSSHLQSMPCFRWVCILIVFCKFWLFFNFFSIFAEFSKCGDSWCPVKRLTAALLREGITFSLGLRLSHRQWLNIYIRMNFISTGFGYFLILSRFMPIFLRKGVVALIYNSQPSSPTSGAHNSQLGVPIDFPFMKFASEQANTLPSLVVFHFSFDLCRIFGV